MHNERISEKEWGLLKGAVRRVFSRSELRRGILEKATVEHYDVSRPRVKKWCKCQQCGDVVPKYTCDVDHIEPVIPVDRALKDMMLDEVVERVWCGAANLQVLCDPCHTKKTSAERKQRTIARRIKKGKK